MNKEQYINYLKSRNFTDDLINNSIKDVLVFESVLNRENLSLNDLTNNNVQKYIDHLIENRMNSLSTLIALGRYFYAIGLDELYIYFTSLLGGIGVYDNIKKRVKELAGEEVSTSIFTDLNIPPLGSSPVKYLPVTEELMKRMKSNLSTRIYQKALAGNNHEILAESFYEYKEIFKKSGNIDEFLKNHHGRSIKTLTQYCQEGKIWFEQKITPEVIEFVSNNQEILSGVRKGNYIYVSKIPYQPAQYLYETNEKNKRYLACHCPLARESIMSDSKSMDYEWCYCSAGFEKFMFDIIFEEDTEVEVLESVLRGDLRCRFAIKIPGRYLTLISSKAV